MRTAYAFALTTLALFLAPQLQVKDLSPSPALYSPTDPKGFTIKAQVSVLGALLPSYTLTSTLATVGTNPNFQVNQAIPMSPTADPSIRQGRLVPTSVTPRLLEGCGFQVRHTALAKVGADVTKASVLSLIRGSPYAQHVAVGGQAVVFPTATGGTVTVSPVTVQPLGSIANIKLQNAYARKLKLTGAALTCGGGDCSSVPARYVVVKEAPSVPVDLDCGDAAGFMVTCFPEMVGEDKIAEAKFETDLGTVVVPFKCGPEGGA